MPKFHVFAHLADAQALRFNHLHDLQLEVCVEYSSGFRIAHGLAVFGFNNLTGCLFLLDHYRFKKYKKHRLPDQATREAIALFGCPMDFLGNTGIERLRLVSKPDWAALGKRYLSAEAYKESTNWR